MKGSIIRQNERQLMVSENYANDRNYTEIIHFEETQLQL